MNSIYLIFSVLLVIPNIQCSEISSSDAFLSRGFWSFLLSPQKTCHCKCGVPNRYGRLLGGEYINDHEFPWLVLVNLKGINNFGGVLINDKYVLTAASPLIGLTAYDVKVNLGVHDRCFPDVASSNMSVENLLIHPDYSPAQRTHDIALVKLSNVVAFERRINPICLPYPGATYIGQVGTVTSWTQGLSPDGDIISTCRPRKIGLPVLDVASCEQFPVENIKEISTVSTHKGCLGVIGALSVICKSDAGGSVQFRSVNGVYETIGVLTDINDCNAKPSTSVFTRVNSHLDWILRNTRDACYCQKN